MSSVAQNISYKFRREISEKINRMPIKYFDKKLMEKYYLESLMM